MPSGFGELTDQAHHLVSAGDLAGARRLLADALTGADPRPANATAELAEAASLQARVLVALGEPHPARGWAAFAYAATTRLHGRSDPRTVAAAATLAAVLHRVGSWSRAARLYQEVILELTASDGPESLRVLAAHADLATVEYARGQCQVARDRLLDAWELHREVYGDGHPSGIKMLARLGAMQRDCGRFGEAHDNLALAEQLCRDNLSPDDPLAGQVAALARAAASPDHACADNAPVGPEPPPVPAARIPPAGDGLSGPPAGPFGPAGAPSTGYAEPRHPAGGYHPSGAHPSGGYEVPTPRQPPDDPADHWWPPEHDTGAHDTDDRPGAYDPDGPGGHDTGDRPGGQGPDRLGGTALPPAVLDLAGSRTTPPGTRPVADAEPWGPADEWRSTTSDDRWPSQTPDDRWPSDTIDDRWPSDTPEDPWRTTGAGDQWDSERDAGLPLTATTAATTTRGGTDTTAATGGTRWDDGDGWAGSGRHPEEATGVHRVRRHAGPDEPYHPSRLLPVPVPREPEPHRARRLVPLVAAGVLVVLLGAAAVIAGFSGVDGDGDPPAAPGTPAPTGPAAATPPAGGPSASRSGGPSGATASPGSPPSQVTLRDNRDNVALRWTYPAGAEGPVVISGGRRGQPQSAFADLPAGSTSFVVHGLNRSTDYCFTVAVAWSTDTVARADEVCTARR
ncbi:Tetratricopeptide repeat-containing protein [Micromonospora nigra]|uniref:Tetratricopeptide repeat-containing protein n=1 Tax=Micromonospora nigra TaxID=145857 RepID=A0A1C6SR24_9ACTN|nr:tetratricopeptide repeat protein [Micromonospora nigra]SCL31753.1 Tetratricopeptide repeat-containing protein [Micromonospora nigra]